MKSTSIDNRIFFIWISAPVAFRFNCLVRWLHRLCFSGIFMWLLSVSDSKWEWEGRFVPRHSQYFLLERTSSRFKSPHVKRRCPCVWKDTLWRIRSPWCHASFLGLQSRLTCPPVPRYDLWLVSLIPSLQKGVNARNPSSSRVAGDHPMGLLILYSARKLRWLPEQNKCSLSATTPPNFSA